MDTIVDVTRKMGVLIDNLLSFSRMERQAISFRPVQMEALVRDIIRELEPDAAGRSIEWRIGELPTVEGDASMPRIVLTSSRESVDLEQCYRLGVNDYMVKPVTFIEFVEAVKQIGVFRVLFNQPPPDSVFEQ